MSKVFGVSSNLNMEFAWMIKLILHGLFLTAFYLKTLTVHVQMIVSTFFSYPALNGSF